MQGLSAVAEEIARASARPMHPPTSGIAPAADISQTLSTARS